MQQKTNLDDCIILTLISRFWEWVELTFLRIDKLSWAEITLFWYFVDLRSYFKQFQLCILNIFHQKQLFSSKLPSWTYSGAGTMVPARMTLKTCLDMSYVCDQKWYTVLFSNNYYLFVYTILQNKRIPFLNGKTNQSKLYVSFKREFIGDSELALIITKLHNFAILRVILRVGQQNRIRVKWVKISKFFFR